MRFLCVYKPSKAEGNLPPEREIAEMGKLIEESTKAGVLLSAEGCMPSVSGARVRLSGGKITVKDGPFSESKELIGGFAIIQFPTMKEAIAFTEKFLKVAGDGETVIRQLYDEPAA